jgi:putative addiction module component (TIGR02574 family)
MSNVSIADLLHLTEAERIQLAQDLWDSISEKTDALPLGVEQIQDYERRLAEHRANPASSIPWEEARAALRARFGA